MLFVWTNLLWISAINLRAGEEAGPVAHNDAQPRSRLVWHHRSSDHIKGAVGGVDFSSVQAPPDASGYLFSLVSCWCSVVPAFICSPCLWVLIFILVFLCLTHSMPFPLLVPTTWLFVLLCVLRFFAPCCSVTLAGSLTSSFFSNVLRKNLHT